MMDSPEGGAAPGTACGFVALIGAPNVGKSTLVNALVGSKVTIVSRKVQTTRALIRGIVIENNAQIILVDTPGIFSPKRRLDRAMVSTAWSGAHDADLVCVLLDAKAGIDEEADAILAKLASVKHEKILVLNKIDLVPREKLLALAKAANERLSFAQTFMVSALSGDGVDDLRRTLARDGAAGTVPLSRRPDVGCADAASGGRDHPGKDLPQAAPGIAVSIHRRDRQLDRAQGQIRSHRADHLCRARKPAQDRARQGRRHHQVDRRGLAQGDRRDSWASPCICSCSSRCAKTGATIPTATAKWDWNSQGNDQARTRNDRSAMNVPKNVLWFEVLLYLSLTLDALSVAFQDRTPSGEMTESVIMVGTVMAGGMILLLVFLVWLAAQRRKNWPRWVLAAALVLSVISLAQVIGDNGVQLDSAIEIVSCVLTAAGLYFSFTGDAVGWFNA